jgi:hypothetical protein
MAIGQPTLKVGALLCFGEILEAQGEVSCARRVLGFAAEHPATDKPERDEIRMRLDRMGATGSTRLAWPGIELDELLDRIVVEEKLAHAPLIALLQRAG